MSSTNKDFDLVDVAFAAKLKELSPPSSLRRELLKLSPTQPAAWWPRLCLVAATALAIVAAIMFWPKGSLIPAAQSDLAALLNSDFDLQFQSKNVPAIRQWLTENTRVGQAELPPLVTTSFPEGCRELLWRGNYGALVCFETPELGLVHLAVFPSSELRGASSLTGMHLRGVGGWNSAVWNHGAYTYFLFGKGTDAQIRSLIAASPGASRSWGLARFRHVPGINSSSASLIKNNTHETTSHSNRDSLRG